MATSIPNAQKQLLQGSLLNDLGSGKASVRLPQLIEYLGKIGGKKFINEATKIINQKNAISSGEMSSMTFNIIELPNGYELTIGYLKENPASQYYDFVNSGVKGMKAGFSEKGYSFKFATPSRKMVLAISNWKKLAGHKTATISRRTYGSLEAKNVNIASEKESEAYQAALNIKRYGIKPRRFMDIAKDATFNKDFNQKMVVAIGKDITTNIKETRWQ